MATRPNFSLATPTAGPWRGVPMNMVRFRTIVLNKERHA